MPYRLLCKPEPGISCIRQLRRPSSKSSEIYHATESNFTRKQSPQDQQCHFESDQSITHDCIWAVSSRSAVSLYTWPSNQSNMTINQTWLQLLLTAPDFSQVSRHSTMSMIHKSGESLEWYLHSRPAGLWSPAGLKYIHCQCLGLSQFQILVPAGQSRFLVPAGLSRFLVPAGLSRFLDLQKHTAMSLHSLA